MSAPALLALAGALASVGLSLRFHWWRPRREGTPILMYHQVGEHRSGSALNKWRVPVPLLERHLDLLCRRGYRGVALRDLLERPDAAEKRAVLTFDDGFDGVRSRALPLLLSRGFSATVFVVAGKLGGTNDWDAERPGEPLLTADGVRELHAAGLEIGSHGLLHRALPGLADGELAEETSASRSLLSGAIGSDVVSFCYPYGAFDDRSVAAVASAGYRAATVIRSGIARGLSDPFRLKRVPVRGTDPLLDLSLALTRGRSKF